jgi:5-methylcytosine-specific restriction enzyme A
LARLQSLPQRLQAVRSAVPTIEKVTEPFYLSREWRDFAKAIKEQRGWRCEQCGMDMSGNRRAFHADHIIERKDGGADFDPLNVRCLCQACHNRKTMRARTDRWR